MNGHSLNAGYQVNFGYNNAGNVTITNRGAITTPTLYVGNVGPYGSRTFDLIQNDSVGTLELKNVVSTLNSSVSTLMLSAQSVATTTATGSVTSIAEIESGSKLILGANLNLGTAANTGLNIQDVNSSLDAQGHSLTANLVYIGVAGTSAVTVSNLGLVTVNSLEVGNGSLITLHGGDTINTSIALSGGSVLTVEETNGTGLTFNGASLGSLTIDPSTISLDFTSNSPSGWDFRWKDPNGGGNWVSTIESLIGSGQITGANGYSVYDSGGYTYIGTASVPEPSSIVLACLATLGVTVAMARRRPLKPTHPKDATARVS